MSEPNARELVVTAMGPDRPGIAAEFSGHVHAAGGNLAESRMVNLRGHFALMVLVEGTNSVLDAVEERLRSASRPMGLVSLDLARGRAKAAREGVPFRLKTYSMDQPGIVHKVTSYLGEQGINVEELETHLESAPFMGTPVFTMEVLLLVPQAIRVSDLRRSLDELAAALNCDVDLEPA